jgi:hypothetical protein
MARGKIGYLQKWEVPADGVLQDWAHARICCFILLTDLSVPSYTVNYYPFHDTVLYLHKCSIRILAELFYRVIREMLCMYIGLHSTVCSAEICPLLEMSNMDRLLRTTSHQHTKHHINIICIMIVTQICIYNPGGVLGRES